MGKIHALWRERPGGQAGNRAAGKDAPLNTMTFTLAPVSPFRLDLTVWTLRRRPENIVDRWDGQRYRRVLVLGDGPVQITVTQTGAPARPRIAVEAASNHPARDAGPAARRAVERLLGIRTDLADFYRLAARDPRLWPLARRFRGAKPPRFPTVFEALVNAIACQQLSLAVGIRLLNRLAEACGMPFPTDGATAHAFPRPADLAALHPETVRRLGFNRAKVRALLELAGAVAGGRLDAEALEAGADEAVATRLTGFRGIGRWSAEYALLRGLGRLNVFPGDDVGARNSLGGWLRLGNPPDSERVRRILARWEPYAGLVYFHLLLARLDDAGLVPPVWRPTPDGERRGGA